MAFQVQVSCQIPSRISTVPIRDSRELFRVEWSGVEKLEQDLVYCGLVRSLSY